MKRDDIAPRRFFEIADMMRENALRKARQRLTQIGDYWVYVSNIGSRYSRSDVYVLELSMPELVARRSLGIPELMTGIRSKLVYRYWVVAKHVHDGKTDKSTGYQARITANLLAHRLNTGEKIKPDWERKYRYGSARSRKVKNSRILPLAKDVEPV